MREREREGGVVVEAVAKHGEAKKKQKIEKRARPSSACSMPHCPRCAARATRTHVASSSRGAAGAETGCRCVRARGRDSARECNRRQARGNKKKKHQTRTCLSSMPSSPPSSPPPLSESEKATPEPRALYRRSSSAVGGFWKQESVSFFCSAWRRRRVKKKKRQARACVTDGALRRASRRDKDFPHASAWHGRRGVDPWRYRIARETTRQGAAAALQVLCMRRGREKGPCPGHDTARAARAQARRSRRASPRPVAGRCGPGCSQAHAAAHTRSFVPARRSARSAGVFISRPKICFKIKKKRTRQVGQPRRRPVRQRGQERVIVQPVGGHGVCVWRGDTESPALFWRPPAPPAGAKSGVGA
jgi:hypothetical protein